MTCIFLYRINLCRFQAGHFVSNVSFDHLSDKNDFHRFSFILLADQITFIMNKMSASTSRSAHVGPNLSNQQ